MFTGSLVALVTPFSDGQVDFETLRELVDFQIQSGIDGLVPVGTTGESPTLSNEEHQKVIEVVVKEAAGRVPVIAGAGSNSTSEAHRDDPVRQERRGRCHFAGHALLQQAHTGRSLSALQGDCRNGRSAGVCFIIFPAAVSLTWTRPPWHAWLRSRTLSPSRRATGSLDQASEIASRCPGLTILSGDDSLTLPLASVGAKGVISVVANIVPTDVKAMTDAILEGDFGTARKWHSKLFKMSKALLSLSTNPIPIKAAMAALKMCSEELRLPMVALNDTQKVTLEGHPQGLRTAGVKPPVTVFRMPRSRQ